MLILQFVFLLVMLYCGSRYGGMGLGVVSGLGLVIEVFVFRMPPSSPPVDVMLTIMAVVSCAAVLEASGGLLYIIRLAEKLFRNNPKYIAVLGPFVSYCMTLMLGTGHAVYSVMPVISDVALKNGVRPERALASASVAAQLGITASPISAAVVLTVSTFAGQGVSLFSVIGVTLPATFVGMLLMSAYCFNRGKDLSEDPEFQRRMQDPMWRHKIDSVNATTFGESIPSGARSSVILFLLALVSVVILAMFPSLRTLEMQAEPVPMNIVIQMIMLAFGGIILMIARPRVGKIPDSTVFKSGMTATLAIFGIAWMSDTYFQHALPVLKDMIFSMVEAWPWCFALAMFAVSVVVNSQAATCRMMLPVAAGLGMPAWLIIGILPSCYGYFFIPNYPSDIAACNFDISGTTKIGKYYLNHSFMLPGLVGVLGACVTGYLLSSLVL